ncbi:MAG: dephospho-CoA kinase [Candidatus Scalinduaceae bacterium]
MKQRVTVIGITGGIASGKSTVAKMLRSLGASVINADNICHQLINTEEIKNKISKKWGNNIQGKDGKINRRALGKIVFADKGKLLVLNKIIHPKVIKRIKSQIAELSVKDKANVIVLDAALLVESNLTNLCDILLFIDAKKHICTKRAQKSRKWPLHETTKREKFQYSMREKREMADIIINNNLSKVNTFNQVKDFWNQFITKN